MNAQSLVDHTNATPIDEPRQAPLTKPVKLTGPQQAAKFIVDLFGLTTEPVHICRFANDKDETLSFKKLDTRDTTAIARFVEKYDEPGRAVYFCVGTLEEGATARNKRKIAEIGFLFADIDFKDLDFADSRKARAYVERRLANLVSPDGRPYPPSYTVFTGHGIHCYWLLTEVINAQAPGMMGRIEHDLKQLADLVGGDLQVCEIARLMRLPGSHNSKYEGESIPVEVLTSNGKRYHLEDLEEMLSDTSPIILRKVRPRPLTVGQAGEADANCPFLRCARERGFKPRIDVKARLNTMMYMGNEDSAVHPTQLAVTSSMLNLGHDIDDVVDLVYAATQTAAGANGANWNWDKEKRRIRKMCETWLNKLALEGKTPKPLSRVKAQGSQEIASPAPSSMGETNPAPASAGSAEVISLAGAAAARKLKPTAVTADVTTIVADGVIEMIRRAGQDIMLSEGEVWLYGEGIWYVMTPAERQWIMTMIQDGFSKLNVAPKTNSINGAYKRLTEHPGLFQRQVPWADPSLIVCQNGVLAVLTGQFMPHSPKHYARRKIGASYDATAGCPEFIKLLTEMFSDRGEEQPKLVELIQECFGAALAPKLLSREQRKALILLGPSRTGKTEVSYSLRSLMGSPIASPSVAEISGTFGLESFYDAVAWIRDDAVNEGDELDAQRFKTIITGEPIDINRKGLPAVLGVSLAMPTLLSANSLPRARDKSDAIYNRSLVVEMTRIFSDEEASEMKKRLGVPPLAEAAMPHIFSTEGSGILNWALIGLKRLMERGRYSPPTSVSKANQSFKDDNNPVGEWVRTCVEAAPADHDGFHCVTRDDLMCAYHGWQREQDGDAARAMGARALFPRLRSAAPWADASSDAYSDANGKRHVTGVKLTEEGLKLWEAHRNNGQQLRGGSVGSSETANAVNKRRRHDDRKRAAVGEETPSQPKARDNRPRF
jgi:P4 family phage/plasmid primase-like protien